MLKFVYCGQFPDDLESTADALLPVAEKYDIQELKDFCACASTPRTGLTKEKVVQTLIFADVYRCPDLAKHCLKHWEEWRALMDKDALEPLKEYPHLLIEMCTFKNKLSVLCDVLINFSLKSILILKPMMVCKLERI